MSHKINRINTTNRLIHLAYCGGKIKSNRLVSKTCALASYDKIGIGVQTMQ